MYSTGWLVFVSEKGLARSLPLPPRTAQYIVGPSFVTAGGPRVQAAKDSNTRQLAAILFARYLLARSLARRKRMSLPARARVAWEEEAVAFFTTRRDSRENDHPVRIGELPRAFKMAPKNVNLKLLAGHHACWSAEADLAGPCWIFWNVCCTVGAICSYFSIIIRRP